MCFRPRSDDPGHCLNQACAKAKRSIKGGHGWAAPAAGFPLWGAGHPTTLSKSRFIGYFWWCFPASILRKQSGFSGTAGCLDCRN